jgi:hypothetical protein
MTKCNQYTANVMNICQEYAEETTSRDLNSRASKITTLEKLLAENMVDRHDEQYVSEKGQHRNGNGALWCVLSNNLVDGGDIIGKR